MQHDVGVGNALYCEEDEIRNSFQLLTHLKNTRHAIPHLNDGLNSLRSESRNWRKESAKLAVFRVRETHTSS